MRKYRVNASDLSRLSKVLHMRNCFHEMTHLRAMCSSTHAHASGLGSCLAPFAVSLPQSESEWSRSWTKRDERFCNADEKNLRETTPT